MKCLTQNSIYHLEAPIVMPVTDRPTSVKTETDERKHRELTVQLELHQ